MSKGRPPPATMGPAVSNIREGKSRAPRFRNGLEIPIPSKNCRRPVAGGEENSSNMTPASLLRLLQVGIVSSSREDLEQNLEPHGNISRDVYSLL